MTRTAACLPTTAPAVPAMAADPADVVATHADNLATAHTLQAAVVALVAAPSAGTLAAPRAAWIADVSYERAVAARGLNRIAFEGSDSRANPTAVFR